MHLCPIQSIAIACEERNKKKEREREKLLHLVSVAFAKIGGHIPVGGVVVTHGNQAVARVQPRLAHESVWALPFEAKRDKSDEER